MHIEVKSHAGEVSNSYWRLYYPRYSVAGITTVLHPCNWMTIGPRKID